MAAAVVYTRAGRASGGTTDGDGGTAAAGNRPMAARRESAIDRSLALTIQAAKSFLYLEHRDISAIQPVNSPGA